MKDESSLTMRTYVLLKPERQSTEELSDQLNAGMQSVGHVLGMMRKRQFVLCEIERQTKYWRLPPHPSRLTVVLRELNRSTEYYSPPPGKIVRRKFMGWDEMVKHLPPPVYILDRVWKGIYDRACTGGREEPAAD